MRRIIPVNSQDIAAKQFRLTVRSGKPEMANHPRPFDTAQGHQLPGLDVADGGSPLTAVAISAILAAKAPSTSRVLVGDRAGI